MVFVAQAFRFELTYLGALPSWLLPLNAHVVINKWESCCYGVVDIFEQSIKD